MPNYQLISQIESLIESQKEGLYWDFKLEHHKNPVDLVHDILCLSNVNYDTKYRFIIVGVEPETYEIIGLDSDEYKNRQAEIIDVLCNVNLAGGNIPQVRVERISVNNNTLDVIVISDSRQKPFFLAKEYKKNNKTLNAGTIYSRIEDRNTSKNSVASSSDIEKMWRKRFNLDLLPKEKIEIYFQDFENWETLNNQTWFYKPYPEFTLQTGDEVKELGAGHDRWTNACINKTAYIDTVEIKYHQTVLWKDLLISFDGGRAQMLSPKFELKHFSGGDEIWYYFLSNNMKYKVNNFLKNVSKKEFVNYSVDEACEYILTLSDEQEYIEFKKYIERNKLPIIDDLDLSHKSDKQFVVNTLEYCTAIKKLFEEFKSEKY